MRARAADLSAGELVDDLVALLAVLAHGVEGEAGEPALQDGGLELVARRFSHSSPMMIMMRLWMKKL